MCAQRLRRRPSTGAPQIAAYLLQRPSRQSRATSGHLLQPQSAAFHADPTTTGAMEKLSADTFVTIGKPNITVNTVGPVLKLFNLNTPQSLLTRCPGTSAVNNFPNSGHDGVGPIELNIMARVV